MANICVGTSGWNYKHWRRRFYPQNLREREYLEFYTQHFDTVEIDYSFYRLPSDEAYESWAERVPSHFIFAVKASRYLTHMKRLHDAQDPWQRVLSGALHLKKHLGPILLQFPAHWKRDDERLEDFLSMVKHNCHRKHLKLVFEFRNKSWLVAETYRTLEKHNAALCIGDSDRWPREDTITTDFTYYRFHGHLVPNYTRRQLEAEAKKMLKLKDKGIDVFVYFNNDTMGFAIKNAKTLMELLGQGKVEPHRQAG